MRFGSIFSRMFLRLFGFVLIAFPSISLAAPSGCCQLTYAQLPNRLIKAVRFDDLQTGVMSKECLFVGGNGNSIAEVKASGECDESFDQGKQCVVALDVKTRKSSARCDALSSTIGALVKEFQQEIKELSNVQVKGVSSSAPVLYQNAHE